MLFGYFIGSFHKSRSNFWGGQKFRTKIFIQWTKPCKCLNKKGSGLKISKVGKSPFRLNFRASIKYFFKDFGHPIRIKAGTLLFSKFIFKNTPSKKKLIRNTKSILNYSYKYLLSSKEIYLLLVLKWHRGIEENNTHRRKRGLSSIR